MTVLFFIVFFSACIAAGLPANFFPTGEWYKSLAKPTWVPPDWVFPIVWLTLYCFISYAAARVAIGPEMSLGMAFWALQISLNTLWTPVFFGLRRIKHGFYILVALWLSVAATMVCFFAVDTIAGVLFVPYLIWVSIAGALNLAVWRLNPEEAERMP
jgi:tryptophan-rich sensory protein